MADIRNGQRMRLWDGSKDFGFTGVSDADNDGGVYVRQHDGTTLLHVAVEDSPAATLNGVAILGVRDDAGGSRVSADGDYHMLSFNASGELRVTGGSGGTSAVDGAAFTFGTTPGTPASFVVDDVATVAVAENSQGVARMSTDRVILMHVTDPTTSTQRQAVSAAGRASVITLAEHDEDDPSAGVETGNLMLGIRDDAGGSRVSADGDFHALSINASGELRVTSGAAGVADNSAFTFGTTNVQPTGFVFDDVATNAVTENSVAAPRISGNRIILTHLADPTVDTQRQAVDANGSAQTRLHGSADFTAANAIDNPIYVQKAVAAITGEVHDHDETDTAKDATSNHDVTPAATLYVTGWTVSSSGAGKYQLVVDRTGTPVIKDTIFLSGSHLTEQHTFDPPIEVTGVDVSVTKRNDDNASQSLYSMIMGIDQ